MDGCGWGSASDGGRRNTKPPVRAGEDRGKRADEASGSQENMDDRSGGVSGQALSDCKVFHRSKARAETSSADLYGRVYAFCHEARRRGGRRLASVGIPLSGVGAMFDGIRRWQKTRVAIPPPWSLFLPRVSKFTRRPIEKERADLTVARANCRRLCDGTETRRSRDYDVRKFFVRRNCRRSYHSNGRSLANSAKSMNTARTKQTCRVGTGMKHLNVLATV